MDDVTSRSTPPLSSYAAHIAFWVWHHSEMPRHDTYSTAMIVAMMVEQHARIPPFVEEVVPLIIGSDNPVTVFCHALSPRDKELLDPSYLAWTLNVSLFVLRGSGIQKISSEERSEALSVLSTVFQRYECNGLMPRTSVDAKRAHIIAMHIIL